MTEEKWLPVAGYEGCYEVSDHGRARSLDRVVLQSNRWGGVSEYHVRGRVLKPVNQAPRPGQRRLSVSLSLEGALKQCTIADLVLSAFVGPRPPETEASHLDGDPTNNAIENLAWRSCSENGDARWARVINEHSWRMGYEAGRKSVGPDVGPHQVQDGIPYMLLDLAGTLQTARNRYYPHHRTDC